MLTLFDLFWVQVCAALVWNLMSAVVGLGGVAYVCWLLADRPPRERFCFTDTWGEGVPTEEEKIKCYNQMQLLNVSYRSAGTSSILISCSPQLISRQ